MYLLKTILFRYIFTFLLFFGLGNSIIGQNYQLHSPNKKIELEITAKVPISYRLYYQGKLELSGGPLYLTSSNGKLPIDGKKIKKIEHSSHHEIFEAVIPVKNKIIKDDYNELKIWFSDKNGMIFRAYDNGIAFRFFTLFKDSVKIYEEGCDIHPLPNGSFLWGNEPKKDFQSHFESLYSDTTLKNLSTGDMCTLPLLVKNKDGCRLVITESDLHDYPNMFMSKYDDTTIRAVFPHVILASHLINDRVRKITELADFTALTSGNRKYPWRIISLNVSDSELLENNLVFTLGTPNVVKNTSWIHPGKVAWDWWNDLNIYGVPFKSGLNTETYKYYIDFASKFSIPYIILDEGWSLSTRNILDSKKEIDLQELIRYGTKKNVRIILWCLWEPLDLDTRHILETYHKWGIAGIKVDFMARADQYMVGFYDKVAAIAAENNLLVDFHGAFKPVGLNRTYPNVLSYEGVRGLENDKWETDITPVHDVKIPFTRMFAGPMDYTPGAMINGGKKDFAIRYSEPMSQGTRAHQVAMYVIYESPLSMLADNPSNYLSDSITTNFITSIPSVWDSTVALNSEVGHFITIARKSGQKWYIGAMTDWEPRSLSLNLSFMGKGTFKAIIYKDGVNADRHPSDYQLYQFIFNNTAPLKIQMLEGGGWTGVFEKIQ